MNHIRNFNSSYNKNQSDISNVVKKIVIIAGDKSGDLYGGHLSKCLKDKFPGLQIYSFGGQELKRYSNQVIDLLSHSVCGIIEVISSLKNIVKVFNQTTEEISRINPDLIILIDFPDFNLRLAKTLNKKYPIFYYVSPQVWAWRKNRLKQIKKYIDQMIVIFKFEKDFYKKEGIDALYFGHPLIDLIKTTNIEKKKIISFLPGSRKNEVKKHLPIMKKAKDLIQKELKGYRFQIIKPLNLKKEFYKDFHSDMEIVNHSYQAIEESTFIIASSGTATIEISILGVPYIIIYKINPISWQILKRMVRLKYVGMANILASKKIVIELLQNKATPKNIATTTIQYLKNEQKYTELQAELEKIKTLLLPSGGINKFANYIANFLNIAADKS